MSKKEKDGNWFKRHKILTVILALVVIGSIGSAIGGGEKNNDGNGTASTQTTKQEEKTDFKVGETATFDDKSITVTEIQRNYDTGNQFAQPESGKEFVIVTISIANNSNTTLDYSTYEFKMQDSNGVQQNEALMALTQGKLSSGALAKGGNVTGKLAYEVPKGDAGLKLLYQNYSLFNNKTITFNLQ
ncbi:MAG: DUF4352 domain-containing protein [Candidatus Saccharimonadales bacterium]